MYHDKHIQTHTVLRAEERTLIYGERAPTDYIAFKSSCYGSNVRLPCNRCNPELGIYW